MRHFEEGQALRYESEVDLSNLNTSLTQLVLLTGRDKKVLEVGPATGYMTKVLQRRGCRVTGIEVDRAAARAAEPYCDRMIVGDIEELDLDEIFGDERFDVVIYGDVLEHLLDPRRTLDRSADLLTPDGYLLASIPNVAHASVRLALLAGRFRYTPEGLLDRTHIRLFDRVEVETLFGEAGYEILEESRIEADVFETEVRLSESSFPRHLVETVRSLPEARTYQFIVKARPAPQGSGARARSGISSAPTEAELPPLSLDAALTRLERELEETRTRLHELEMWHSRTTASVGYRLVEGLRRRIERHAPWGTRRRSLLMAPARAGRLLVDRGVGPFLAHLLKVWRWAPRLWQPALPDLDGLTQAERYSLWLSMHVASRSKLREMRRRAKRFAYRPVISVIMRVRDTREEWLRAAIESIRAQVWGAWELCLADDCSTGAEVRKVLNDYERKDARVKVTYLDEPHGIAGGLNAALGLATGDFVAFIDQGDELKPSALFEIVALLNDRRDLDVVFTDEDVKDAAGRLVDPFFKPGFSPDLILEFNYATRLTVYRREAVAHVGGMRPQFEGSPAYDLLLRVLESTKGVGHVPLPLYSRRVGTGSPGPHPSTAGHVHRSERRALEDALARRGVRAQVESGSSPGRHRIRYEISGAPKVVVIVPTRDRVDLLRRCIDSIRERSTYRNYEIVIVDNDSSDPRTLDYLDSFSGRVLRYPGEFHFAGMMNFAVQEVGPADFFLFLNNDTEVVTQDWIEAMVEHGQRSDVAAVGARLLYPDGTPQHEGIVLGSGLRGPENLDCRGYFGLGDSVRNCSAVTGACMLVRSSVYRELGGFEERFRVAFNDVDFCLRAIEKGYLIVYTPYAVLHHEERASRGRAPHEDDDRYFRVRWGGHRDEYMSPHWLPMASGHEILQAPMMASSRSPELLADHRAGHDA